MATGLRPSILAFACLCLCLLGTPLPLAADTSGLGEGDVVTISVFGFPDLSGTSRVSDEGTISVALLGEVDVGGLSKGEAERKIAQLLGDGGYVRDAQVTIFVDERGVVPGMNVTILGQVSQSGKYPLQDDTTEGVATLVDLLAVAGGTTEFAADHLLLVRSEGEASNKVRVDLEKLLRQGDLSMNLSLAEGDTVLVPPMDVFYIYGQVQRPGRYRLERDMTVMQALSVASGLTDRGNEGGIVLNRRTADGIRSIKSSPEDQLEPNDVIYVKDSLF